MWILFCWISLWFFAVNPDNAKPVEVEQPITFDGRCPFCIKEGKRSKVFTSGASFMTSMNANPYYDEDGTYHDNDPNIRTSFYRCSNAHEFFTQTQYGKTTVAKVDDLSPVDYGGFSGMPGILWAEEEEDETVTEK